MDSTAQSVGVRRRLALGQSQLRVRAVPNGISHSRLGELRPKASHGVRGGARQQTTARSRLEAADAGVPRGLSPVPQRAAPRARRRGLFLRFERLSTVRAHQLSVLRFSQARSEERRVGKSVDLGGRRIIKKKKKEKNR